MADKSDKASISTLSTKQKVIGAITVVIFGFIIYEVIGMFSSGTPAETVVTPPAPAAAMNANKPMSTATATHATMPAQAQGQSNVPVPVNLITPSKDIGDLQKQQQEQQQAYLDTVNQLQLLKVKKDIAETNQAIATARLATETANKNMSDLLTQPTLPMGQVMGNYPAKLSGTAITSPNVSGMVQTSEQQIIRPQVQQELPYSVVSVSMRFNRWAAVLRLQDKLYSVSIGDSLVDGSVVVSINKNGVTLSKDGKRRKISIQAAIS